MQELLFMHGFVHRLIQGLSQEFMQILHRFIQTMHIQLQVTHRGSVMYLGLEYCNDFYPEVTRLQLCSYAPTGIMIK